MHAANADTPKTARRREREARAISQMVGIYCAASHAGSKTCTAHCGDPLCEECAEIDANAVRRVRACRNMDARTSCAQCPNRCRTPQELEAIRQVMRVAGPRMVARHPVSSLLHLFHR